MVKLYTSLLAFTLATGLVLASSESNDYQRRNYLQSRGFVDSDEEDLFVRDDDFDDLEAREPNKFKKAIKAASAVYKFGKKVAGHKHTKTVVKALHVGSQIFGTFFSRELEDGDEDNFVRDLDDEEELFGREFDLLDERNTFDDDLD